MYNQNIMQHIINYAKSSSDIPICAAIIINDEIISIATNKSEHSFEHAEFLVVYETMQKFNLKYLETASIYVTLEPCAFCAALLANVRIQNIYFGAYSVKTGGIINGCRIFDYTQHKPVIIGGIKEMECTKILQDFFNTKR